jgi:uncharacterized glyoxalase superfamily protein PhnB
MMSSSAAIETTRIFPVLRYRNAHAMIAWLVRAFGFRRHAVHEDGAGGVAHAQLAFGSGLIMLSSARDDDFARLATPPSGGRAVQTVYLAVDEIDAHHAIAVAADAEILMPPTDQDYGSRDYICRDPEGNVWCFGTYWPSALETTAGG